jgi:hypothetical protein
MEVKGIENILSMGKNQGKKVARRVKKRLRMGETGKIILF